MRRPVPTLRQSRGALLLTTAALVAVVALGAAPAASQTNDPVATADAEITRLRAEADALADEYFDALAGLTEVQTRIDELEGRIPVLAAQVDDLRAQTRARAVIAYKRAGLALGSLIGSDDALGAARRAQWLDRLNARDDLIAAELRATTSRLGAQREALRVTRQDGTTALDDVRARGQAIDALLVDAEEQRRIAVATTTTTAPTADPSVAPIPAPTGSATAGSRPPTSTAPGAETPTAPASYTPTAGVHPRHDEPFLVCTRSRESSGNYRAANPAGPYLGAYQFLQATWNSAANHAGRHDLVGVPPNTASPYDQDDVAWSLYEWQGSRPWGGHCDAE